MSAANPPRPLDPAVVVAREKEDVLVGNEIVRHKLSSRIIHWSVAVTFFLCLFTGMPIWTPLFGWMAALFGGLSVCRVLHPWVGLAFFVAAVVMTVDWAGQMHLDRTQKGWWGPQALPLPALGARGRERRQVQRRPEVLFLDGRPRRPRASSLSGLVMWFPGSFPPLRAPAFRHPSRRRVHPVRRGGRSSTSTSAPRPNLAPSAR